MHSLACSFWPHVLQNPRLLPSKRVEEINIACSLKQFKFVWLLRGWARCCDFLMSHIHHIRQENSLHCNKFDETLLFRFLHWEKNKDVYSQLSCKAIFSSYQCNSHRDAVSLFMQLSTIKRNIISMLFFYCLALHSHLTDTIHGRLSFCPEHTGGIAALFHPPTRPPITSWLTQAVA